MAWKNELLEAYKAAKAVYDMTKSCHLREGNLIDLDSVRYHLRIAIFCFNNVLTELPLPGEYSEEWAEANHFIFKG